MSVHSIEKLIPHRNSMRLVDCVSEYSNGSGEVRIQVDSRKPYFENGKFKSIWSVELMAQSVAAIYGMSAAESDGPKVGYIIAIDHYSLESKEAVEEGAELVVRVSCEHHTAPIGIYSAEVFHRGEIYSRSKLKAYLTDREIA